MNGAAFSLIAIAGAALIMRQVHLTYFKPEEFRQWSGQMSPDLLQRLDEFRERWGAPVVVSAAVGGIGRELGDDHDSQHNVDRWGEVRAVDVFPKIEIAPGVYRWMQTAEERKRARTLARMVGFTGIGLYTDTKPGNMLHVDVRHDRVKGNPAEWARVDGAYVGIGQVLV